MDAEQTGYARYRQVVSQLMCGDEQLPSLPVITLEIRRSLRSPEVSLGTLSGLISKDPALSALLMKYAASAMLRSSRPPKTLQDVLQVLGLAQVDRVTMIHSIKSLFTLHSPGHKKLFIEAWERLILKASTCSFLARLVGYTQPDHAFLASLLSELGSLAVLSAFRDDPVAPSRELYYRLCRDYSKSLGVILLKKWAVDEEFIGIIRNTGNWLHRERYHLELIDLVNLSLYHSVKGMNAEADLPELSSLAAYAKLLPPLNVIGDNDELALLISHRAEIHALADALR